MTISYYNRFVQDDLHELLLRKIPYDKLKDKAVLITGANGMLPTYIVYMLQYLNEKCNFNIKIYALVRNSHKAHMRFKGIRESGNFFLLEQDVCEPLHIDGQIDYIIHAAGNASPKCIINDPVDIIKANSIGTLNVLELARMKKIKKIIYTSTREVYGKMNENITEIGESDFGILDTMEIRSCYPESKRLAETMFACYGYQYDLHCCVARIAHSYGPGMAIENDGRVMADFIGDIVNKRDIILKSTGEAKRAFCYISDTIAALILILLEGEDGAAYNVANETEERKICDVADMLIKMYPEQNSKLLYNIPKTQGIGYSKMGRVKLSTRKLEDLGWKPEISLENGLKRTVDSFIYSD
ncbi:NAD-dependent epimerase/dehydratase family protein [Blautia marasmi]|uniref:NAD-dependent epimerase/dehydratase family protein n=1 Tax=Blautia marasmi TaxID=1917868 RepID=UPI000CF24000|nr:NAD-dependent epimerase/dehydratase family protein [Blautia marasmi]